MTDRCQDSSGKYSYNNTSYLSKSFTINVFAYYLAHYLNGLKIGLIVFDWSDLKILAGNKVKLVGGKVYIPSGTSTCYSRALPGHFATMDGTGFSILPRVVIIKKRILKRNLP